jgi:hypothetical protein
VTIPRTVRRSAIAGAAVLVAAALPAGAATTPATVVLDGKKLVSIRDTLAGSPGTSLKSALASLKKSADAALTAGPWSVMDKKQKPASGDKHDYYSQAPYWWPGSTPTAANPLGCPYVQKDGDRNPQLLDGLAVLDSGAPGWTGTDRSGMKRWFSDLLTWLRTSAQGKAEAAAKNNHGTFYDVLESTIAVYIGQSSLAKSVVTAAKKARIDVQIQGDGKQPLELSRTRSWHYSNVNVIALCQLAATGRHLGVDLWTYKNPSGGTIAKAVDFRIPGAEKGRAAWPYQEILDFDQTLTRYPLHAAAAGGDSKARSALPKVPSPAGGDAWPLLPSC